jgi:hypothetical protein
MQFQDQEYVKPDTKLVLQSVETRKALCINEAGQFALLGTDYVAMSQVWIEGVGASLDNRSLQRCLLSDIFYKIRPVIVQWIWLVSLTIPGGVGGDQLYGG